jgi:RNA polymerase sigma-70 factor (ECF subfamily)
MCQSDEQLVSRSLDGHPESFRHLVERYEGPLVGYLAGRLRDENLAAEAAQESFVRGYFGLAKLKNPAVFLSWLLGIADRVAKEMLRARRRRREVASDREPVEEAGDESETSDDQLRRAVADLPEVYREVILLRFYRSLSCAEIGRQQGVPVGTVTKRLSRAYALLEEALRNAGRELDREVPQ